MPTINLSLKEKIGQLFMIGFYGNRLPSETQKLIEENNIGFTILFSRNIETIPQVKELTGSIHTLGKIPVSIYTDQEGGPIVRFKEMAATVISPMGLTATGSPENSEIAGKLIAEDMRICGIDGVFAPVLDVNIEEDNPVIGIRSFSDQPHVVIEYADRFCRGLNAGGTLNCVKHYPGHGAASADSHLEIPIIPISFEYFMSYCFQPFEAMVKRGVDSILTAHILFPQISPDISTFSPYLVGELLRKTAGYKGVVFTDCLEMKAVKDHYSPGEIVLKSINAGIDVMIPSHSLDFQKELLDALYFYVKKGVIPEKRIDESVERILALKSKLKKNVKPGSSDSMPRKNIAVERRIAEQSVTLLRNRAGILPVNKSNRFLVLEWAEQISVPAISENEGQSIVERISGQFLENRDYMALKPSEPLPDYLFSRLNEIHYDYIIACIYSRSGEKAMRQSGSIQKLLNSRKDSIIVSLESPYEIKKFPSADTFIVSYGFRKIQVEALFKVLTGEINPSGKCPVEIRNLFPRGYGING